MQLLEGEADGKETFRHISREIARESFLPERCNLSAIVLERAIQRVARGRRRARYEGGPAWSQVISSGSADLRKRRSQPFPECLRKRHDRCPTDHHQIVAQPN